LTSHLRFLLNFLVSHSTLIHLDVHVCVFEDCNSWYAQ
jgi:hypothetical protein